MKHAFNRVKRLQLPSIEGKKLHDCARDKHWRERSLDNSFEKEQHSQPAAIVSVYEINSNWNGICDEIILSQIFGEHIPYPYDAQVEWWAEHKALFLERGYTFTLPTIEWLIQQHEQGEDVGIPRGPQAEWCTSIFYAERVWWRTDPETLAVVPGGQLILPIVLTYETGRFGSGWNLKSLRSFSYSYYKRVPRPTHRVFIRTLDVDSF